MIDTAMDDIIPMDENHTEFSLDTSTTKSEFLMEQAQNIYCRTATLQIGCQAFELYLDHRGLLFCKSIVDKAMTVVAPDSLQKRIFYLLRHPPNSAHQVNAVCMKRSYKPITGVIRLEKFMWQSPRVRVMQGKESRTDKGELKVVPCKNSPEIFCYRYLRSTTENAPKKVVVSHYRPQIQANKSFTDIKNYSFTRDEAVP